MLAARVLLCSNIVAAVLLVTSILKFTSRISRNPGCWLRLAIDNISIVFYLNKKLARHYEHTRKRDLEVALSGFGLFYFPGLPLIIYRESMRFVSRLNQGLFVLSHKSRVFWIKNKLIFFSGRPLGNPDHRNAYFEII